MSEPEQKSLTLDSQLQQIIERVLHQCKIESEKGTLQIPIREYKERVAYYTGLPNYYIDAVEANELSTLNVQHFNLDIETVMCIYGTMREIYSSSKFPTFQDVYNKTKIEVQKVIIKFGYTLAEFQIILAQLGFEYKPTATKSLLIENPKETFERYNFLSTMRKMRQIRMPIYYIDARIIDESKTFPKLQRVSDLSNTNSYTYFHTISNTNVHNGLFCYNVKERDFFKWLTDIVLPHFKDKSVFVLDNSPLHGKNSSNTITRYHPKADMLKWLRDHNIPCTGSMHKAELYYLIENSGDRIKEFYSTDQAIQAHGHTVVRLPKAINNLSPTDLLWKHISSEFQTEPTMKEQNYLMGIKYWVDESLSKMECKKFVGFYNKITAYEEELCRIDVDIDNALEKYNVMIPPVNQEKNLMTLCN